MNIILNRNLSGAKGNLVKGVLLLMGKEIVSLNVKENLLYLAPEGSYLLRYEESGRFKRKLWELYGVSKRSELKLHIGSRAEDSRGCILLGGDSLDMLHSHLHSGKTYIINIRNN